MKRSIPVLLLFGLVVVCDCVCVCVILFHSEKLCRIRRALNVGEELQKETLPLKSGSCLYQISGLKSQTWYEVKISYPASVRVELFISFQHFL